MEELRNCDYNNGAFDVAVDRDVLRERTTEEQIKLMEELRNYDYNDNAYKIIVDRDVLREKTTEEQIKLIENAYIKSKQSKLINHSENMKKVSNITEFKMYLKELRQELGKDTDVKSDTVVLKFTPDKKKNKKEN